MEATKRAKLATDSCLPLCVCDILSLTTVHIALVLHALWQPLLIGFVGPVRVPANGVRIVPNLVIEHHRRTVNRTSDVVRPRPCQNRDG